MTTYFNEIDLNVNANANNDVVEWVLNEVDPR